jgi:ATP-dependent DNA helicase RecQ
MKMFKAAEENLKSIFQLSDFRPLQRNIIEHILSLGPSALILMPTGSGKSLTYQLPATVLPGLTLVISPLKALMKDQVDRLFKQGVRASFVNSDVKKEERLRRQEQLRKGKYQIFYVTPERFRKKEFIEIISALPVSLLVVDEAHCISQWGHDFRPEYSRVGEFQKLIAECPQSRHLVTMALTATATQEVAEDILSRLNISHENIFRMPIARPNLAVSVVDIYGLENKVLKVADMLKSAKGTTIIYFSLIQTLQIFSSELKKCKIVHECFHGDMAEPQKRHAQDNFLHGRTAVILATPAFGLGIDKSDVRTVIHVEIPGSIEAYFQEIGRAGRDGEPSKCILLYDEDDVSTQMEFIKWSNPEATYIKKIFELIKKNPERVLQEKYDFLREQMNFHNKRDFRVETAVNLLTMWGYVEGWAVADGISTDLDQLIDEPNRDLRQKKQNEKLLSLVRWVNSDECRMVGIYNYFSETNVKPCGLCDNCAL